MIMNRAQNFYKKCFQKVFLEFSHKISLNFLMKFPFFTFLCLLLACCSSSTWWDFKIMMTYNNFFTLFLEHLKNLIGSTGLDRWFQLKVTVEFSAEYTNQFFCAEFSDVFDGIFCRIFQLNISRFSEFFPRTF